MKRVFVVLIGLVFLLVDTSFLLAQETGDESGILDGAYLRRHNQDRKPVPYQYVREADVMWSKKVWRIIDLHEKMNHILYYPERPMQDRFSLIDLMMKSIEANEITAYNPNASEFDEFAEPTTFEQIKITFGAVDEEIDVEDENGNVTKKKIKGAYNSSEVKQYMIKEEWFFDKQRSVLEVRIVGICPIRFYYKPDDINQETVQKAKLFWVYFPHARKVFANHLVFNVKNDAQYLTFDDIFFKRFFTSFIYQESNSYNNRAINQYALGLESLMESERIQDNIRNFESDLWEY